MTASGIRQMYSPGGGVNRSGTVGFLSLGEEAGHQHYLVVNAGTLVC